MNNDLELVPKETMEVWKLVKSFIGRHRLHTGGCKTFYTPSEWKYRKESYCQNALLIVVYDGSNVRELFDPRFGYKLMEKFTKYLNEKGYYFECGTHWYSGIYRKQFPPLAIVTII